MSQAGVVLEKDHDSHIARLTFCNPSKRNAFNPAWNGLMNEYLDDVAGDDDLKVLIVRGEGGTFSSGVDLNYVYDWYAKEGDKRRPSQRRRLSVDRQGQRWFHTFAGYPKATVAQVETYALGLGFELALMADIAVVGESTKIGMPATRFLGPILGNLPLFFYRLGPVLTKRLLLTGDTKTGRELAHLGVFAEVVPDERVAEETEALAARIAKMPADGVHLAKEAYRLVETSQNLGLEEPLSYFLHSMGTNLRFEEDEFNFVRTRSQVGTGRAFELRDDFYEGAP